jgi:hypothetical protein
VAFRFSKVLTAHRRVTFSWLPHLAGQPSLGAWRLPIFVTCKSEGHCVENTPPITRRQWTRDETKQSCVASQDSRSVSHVTKSKARTMSILICHTLCPFVYLLYSLGAPNPATLLHVSVTLSPHHPAANFPPVRSTRYPPSARSNRLSGIGIPSNPCIPDA